MKKYVLFIILLCLMIYPITVYAGRGCCSSHGGVCGCGKYGKQACCDGTMSPTCTCTPPKVYGCTDYKANNYNRDANTDDGSCTYTIRGCTDVNAKNYNSQANQDDGSCQYDVKGCKDYKAKNYNSSATIDDGSCEYEETTDNNLNYSTQDDNTDDSFGISGLLGLITTVGIGAFIYGNKKKK